MAAGAIAAVIVEQLDAGLLQATAAAGIVSPRRVHFIVVMMVVVVAVVAMEAMVAGIAAVVMVVGVVAATGIV